MQIKKLLQEDDAVSPVIGVILMVAITVILAAVIASFVLGLGGSQQQTPQASFSWDYDESADDDDSDGVTTISHDGGDSIPAEELYIRGDAGSLSSTNTPSSTMDISSTGDSWDTGGDASGDDSEVVSGDEATINTGDDFDLDLVWQPQEGDTSATLSSETGPDA